MVCGGTQKLRAYCGGLLIALCLLPSQSFAAQAGTVEGEQPKSVTDLESEPEASEEGVVSPYPMMMGIDRQPERVWFLPIVNYNSDVGVGYGGLLTYKASSVEGEPDQAIRLVAFYSALKAARTGFSWERAPGELGVHALLLAFYDQTYYSNYYGVGNFVDPQLSTQQVGDGVDIGEQFYTQFTLRVPHAHLLLQYPLANRSHVKLFAAVRERRVFVEPFSKARVEEETGVLLSDDYQSLLEEQQPYGYEGGLVSTAQVGVLVDSRDVVVAPSEGGFNELSVRAGLYEEKTFSGVNLTLRRYVPLRGSFVLASRVVADFQFGDVPFYELAAFGASEYYSGLGGTLAGRGLKLRHFIGRGKVLWGPELRFTPYDFTVRGAHADLSGAVFLESGRVWENYENQGNGVGLHSQVGAGIRLVWDHRVLIRFDVAKSLRDDDPVGVYLVFGHPY